MTERDPLDDLLKVATDRIESPGLEHGALRLAHRRLKRRRVAMAATAAVCVAAAVIGGVQAGRDRSGTVPPVAPIHLTPQEKVWPEWDPAAELPAAPDDIAPALPDLIEPPMSSPLIAEDPVGSAVAVVVDNEGDGLVQVLGKDGGWRTVPSDGDYPAATLSPDGTRVSVTYYADYNKGAVIHDLGTGVSRTLPFPDDYEPFDDSQWIFIDENRLLLIAGDRAWEVDAFGGSAERLPEGIGGGLSVAVDPSGGILGSADHVKPNLLTDYAGGKVRTVSMDRTGRLSAVRADADTVVGTAYVGRPFAVVVADRETLTPQVVLPVRDVDASYGNGGLSTFALTSDGIVLLRVATLGKGREGFRVVAWNPATGELSVVSRTEERLGVDFAENLLR